MNDVLTPVLALIVWSLLIWILLFVRRIPAMTKARVTAEQGRVPSDYDGLLPYKAQAAAHNYNHLMEQPTIFYALAVYLHLTGAGAGLAAWLAWGYVALRVAHSAVQVGVGPVMVRFGLFVLSTLCLFGMVGVALLG